jgi:hypothetical protein
VNNAAIIGSGQNAGGIAGRISGSRIENSVNNASVTNGQNNGGIVGIAERGSSITDSEVGSGTSITGVSSIGGIVGRLISSSVENVNVYAQVTGTGNQSFTGGIAGSSTNSVIRNGVVNRDVSGRNSTGGIAGEFISNAFDASGLIENSVVNGRVFVNPVSSATANTGSGIIGTSSITSTGRLNIRNTFLMAILSLTLEQQVYLQV